MGILIYMYFFSKADFIRVRCTISLPEQTGRFSVLYFNRHNRTHLMGYFTDQKRSNKKSSLLGLIHMSMSPCQGLFLPAWIGQVFCAPCAGSLFKSMKGYTDLHVHPGVYIHVSQQTAFWSVHQTHIRPEILSANKLLYTLLELHIVPRNLWGLHNLSTSVDKRSVLCPRVTMLLLHGFNKASKYCYSRTGSVLVAGSPGGNTGRKC